MLVVGVGLVGGSAALASRGRGPFGEVWGHDVDPRALERLPEGVEAVGTHPMAGSTSSGVEAARPDLFQDAAWALVETSRTGVACTLRAG